MQIFIWIRFYINIPTRNVPTRDVSTGKWILIVECAVS